MSLEALGCRGQRRNMEESRVLNHCLYENPPAALEHWWCNLCKWDIHFFCIGVFVHFVTAVKINLIDTLGSAKVMSLGLSFLFYKWKEFAILASLLFPNIWNTWDFCTFCFLCLKVLFSETHMADTLNPQFSLNVTLSVSPPWLL